MTRRILSRLLIAALASTLLAGAASAEDLGARFRRLTLSFLAGWMVYHPEQATLLGNHVEDNRLPDLSAHGLSQRRDWLEAQRESLLAVPFARLPSQDAVDLRLLRHQVDLELRELNEERRPQQDPRWPLLLLRTAFAGHLLGGFGSPCTRAEHLAKRMAKVPEYLRDAQLNLVAPSRACTELAIEMCASLITMCRTAPADAFTECREPRFIADAAVADSQAVTALLAYRDYLIDQVLPGSLDAFPIDSAGLALRLGVSEGLSPPLDSLLAQTRQALAELPAAPVDSNMATPADTIPSTESMSAGLDSLRALLSKNGPFPPLQDEKISVRVRAPLGAIECPGVLAVTGPFEGHAPVARLDLSGWPWTGAGAIERDPRADRAALTLLLASQGLPGRGLFAMTQSRVVSRTRQAIGWRSSEDAWSRYAERQLVQFRRGAWRASLEGRRVALERERLARAAAELMLRVDGASVEAAQEWLVSAAGLPPLDAERAALLAAADPSFAASTLALNQLEQARRRAERELGSRFRLVRFHDAFLKQGAVPAPWIETDLMRAMTGRRKGS